MLLFGMLVNSCKHILIGDLKVAMRRPGRWLVPLTFFVLTVAVFPLGSAVQNTQLTIFAPAAIWVCALLALMLAQDSLFRDDFVEGNLDLLLLTSQPLAILVLVKTMAQWLLTGLPAALLAPGLGVMLGLESDIALLLGLTLLLGTPTIGLLGACGAALTVGLRSGGSLLVLLVLPLSVPVLIFATATVRTAAGELPFSQHLLLLASLLVAAIGLLPAVIASGLKIAGSST